LLDQDGDENDVVDAENDLEQRERQEGQPDVRIGNQGGERSVMAGGRGPLS
jgi:hypothetical protein